MFKLSIVIVCIAIFGSAMCEAELKEEIVKGRADEIAKWAANKLPEYAGLKGSLFVQDVQSIAKSQEKEKFNFDLTVNYGVVGEETSFKTCQISVVDIPTENVRLFKNEPSCRDNAAF